MADISGVFPMVKSVHWNLLLLSSVSMMTLTAYSRSIHDRVLYLIAFGGGIVIHNYSLRATAVTQTYIVKGIHVHEDHY